MLWRLRTGAPWRDLPERYGPWQTVYERFARWEADGTWARLLEYVQVKDDAVGTLEWTRVGGLHHQPCPPARRRSSQKGALAQDELEDPPHPAVGQALGRSRGGLTTKVHLAADGRGLPLAIVVTPGNVNDSTFFDTVLDAVRVPRLSAGRPRRRPETVIADKAYSSRAIRTGLRRRGIRAVIPERSDQIANRKRRGSGRRAAASLRSRAVQGPQCGRTLLQQAQAVPGRRHPLRQVGCPLPCRSPTRLAHPLAPQTVIICQTRPSRRARPHHQGDSSEQPSLPGRHPVHPGLGKVSTPASDAVTSDDQCR